MLVLGSLVGLTLVAAVISILLVHSVLEDLIRLDASAVASGTVTESAAETGRQRTVLIHKLRATGLVVGVVFLALLNASIVVVLRTTAMVLRPVDLLVAGSRKLAKEQFDHRVPLDQADEFGELARAYNDLAGQLQSNEQRKVQTLHQVARTLNHELNNAINTIDLQRTVLGRRYRDDPALSEPLRSMRDSLAGMTGTIADLKRVRRIVLMDYTAGVPMLDLQRSVEDDSPSECNRPLTKHETAT